VFAPTMARGSSNLFPVPSPGQSRSSSTVIREGAKLG
jgi:hypothetical protein